MLTAADQARIQAHIEQSCPNLRARNAPRPDGSPAQLLVWAVSGNAWSSMEELLAHGVPPTGTLAGGNTALHLAVQSTQQHLPAVRALLQRGADVHARNDEARTPLHQACATAWRHKSAAAPYRETIELLLEHGADVNAISSTGETPIVCARDDVKLLLMDRGAQADVVTTEGRTPLHLVEDPEVARKLIAHGGDVRKGGWSGGKTPLHLVVSKEVARVLLDAGADPDAPDAEGRTPLHDLAKRGPADAARLLVSSGAKLDARDRDGNTPLHLSGLTVARALLGVGAETRLTNGEGRASLAECLRRWAASGISWEANGAKAVLAFLEAGADPNARDGSGRTAMHEALSSVKKADLPRLLMARGGDLMVKDDAGATPLDLLRKRPRMSKLAAELGSL